MNTAWKFYFHSVKIILLLKKITKIWIKQSILNINKNIGSLVSNKEKKKRKEFVKNELIIIKIQVINRINIYVMRSYNLNDIFL